MGMWSSSDASEVSIAFNSLSSFGAGKTDSVSSGKSIPLNGATITGSGGGGNVFVLRNNECALVTMLTRLRIINTCRRILNGVENGLELRNGSNDKCIR